ncbi:MAG: hypothetical protein HYX63_16620 [Gammaproteobacteria bacterium]|nr:hypothetical protein [Gammaproteobacteria bacterium]
MADVNSIKTIDEVSPGHVRYIGRKATLIAAGVAATEDMFPARGKKRRYITDQRLRPTPAYFATTKRGPKFMVTRSIYWNDPE